MEPVAKKRKCLTLQVNARIEPTTGLEVAKAFAYAGIAPSEATRALYARTASHGSPLGSEGDLVVGTSEDDEARATQKAAFERATHAFDNMLVCYGFTIDVEDIVPLTEEEIEEATYQNYLSGDAL